MEEKNELNDIILNRNSASGGNKKLLLAVATLSLILIIVVVIMNALQSQSNDYLPQAVLPPEPIVKDTPPQEDPLFEPVEVVEEKVDADAKLQQIAQKLKQESQQAQQTAPAQEEVIVAEPAPLTPPKAVPKPVAVSKPQTPPAAAKVPEFPKTVAAPSVAPKGKHYIQIGSFSKLPPSNALIKKIETLGLTYMYHKVDNLTKVLIGPYNSEAEARKALQEVRRTIEPGAFLTKV